jgi:hypothetical protein
MTEVYIECGECLDFGVYSNNEMVNHLLNAHTGYTLETAKEYANLWEEDALERQEAAEIEYYQSGAYKADKADEDPL